MTDRIRELEAQFKECERELVMRRRMYPNWVGKGTMTQQQADRQMHLMEGIKETVREVMQQEKMRGMTGDLIK